MDLKSLSTVDLKKLGDTIRTIRLQKGLSQAAISASLDISDVAFSKIERGLSNISIGRLYQIAQYLQTPLTQLIDDSYEQSNQIESLEIRVRNLEIKIERLVQSMQLQ